MYRGLSIVRSNAFAFKFDTRGPLGPSIQLKQRSDRQRVKSLWQGLFGGGKLALVTPTNLSDEAATDNRTTRPLSIRYVVPYALLSCKPEEVESLPPAVKEAKAWLWSLLHL